MAKRRRNLIIAGSAVAVLIFLLAFFTNPDQAAHLKAITDTIALRSSNNPPLISLSVVHYNNYLIFSTTTFGDTPLTYGYFGRIQTTNGIGIFLGVP